MSKATFFKICLALAIFGILTISGVAANPYNPAFNTAGHVVGNITDPVNNIVTLDPTLSIISSQDCSI